MSKHKTRSEKARRRKAAKREGVCKRHDRQNGWQFEQGKPNDETL